ncbi:MAG: hypothetical protein JW776_05010 [Candidatus Lokiarchaeota archaeon]|nr:hypothetical protein [Candidatus Lokiarchaeota archaeon]
MEEKQDHIEVGAFFDALEKELEIDDQSSKHSLVERKPLIPKKQMQHHPSFPYQETNSIKIQRKTPLDYMIRKNQEVKSSQTHKLPTYNDYQNQISNRNRLDPISKTTAYPNYSENSGVPQLNEPPNSIPPRNFQQESTLSSNSSLYNRYYVTDRPKISHPPEQTPDNSYLRTQMLKELRTQQNRQPIEISRSRLQPPTVPLSPHSTSSSVCSPQKSPPMIDMDSYYIEEESNIKQQYINEVDLIRCLREIRDKAKIDVILELLDGQWHDENELLRVAKKTRDFIGVVGFGMLMYSFEDSVSKSFLIKKVNPGNSSWFKINDNYIQLARSAYSQYKKTEN